LADTVKKIFYILRGAGMVVIACYLDLQLPMESGVKHHKPKPKPLITM